MKNTLLFYISLSALFLLSADILKAQNFTARKHSISYFSKSADCTNSETILVRVKYSVPGADPNALIITHQYSDGVQISRNVQKTDKKGNIVYDFCVYKIYKEEIISTFKTEKGEISNTIKVLIDTGKAEIISGTPPKTLKL